MTLTTSFRMTNQTSWFVNNCMLGHERINTVKNGPLVEYYICNSYKIYETLGKQIINMIKHEGIKEEDIFILSPSIKSENPYKKLENYLVKEGYKCMTPTSDDAKLDDSVINKKIVFTTYHQSKGRERKVVILYSFDNSYFDYYLKGENSKVCPNILYVGATRAMHKLILIHDSKYKQLDFLNMNIPNINKYVQIFNLEALKLTGNTKTITSDHNTTVTDLIKFIDSYIMDNILLLIEHLFTTVSKNNNIVNIPSKVKNIDERNKETYEDVSDLNGLVIPAIYEKTINNASTIEDYVTKNMSAGYYNEIKKYVKKVNIPCQKISDYLKVGNIYLSMHNKLHFKLAQIKKYNWLDKKMIAECHKNMDFLKNQNLIFEQTISNSEEEEIFKIIHREYGLIKIGSRLDAFDDKTVYEFKCVDSISIEHKLQLVLYCWLWKNSNLQKTYGNRDFKLLNIRTGELLQLVNDNFKITQVVELILANKFVKKRILLDDEFINQIHKTETKMVKK